jgi:hypothetical protein
MWLTGFQILEFFSDLDLIVKIFVLLLIISFVFNHLGKGPMAWIVIIGLAYFILWDAWKFFGPVYILYMFLAMGFVGFLIDYFFMASPLQVKKKQQAMEEEGGSSRDSEDFRKHHKAHSGPQHLGAPRPSAPPPG